MKYKFPIIASICVAAVVIILVSSPENSVSPSEYEQYISATFAPSFHPGLYRGYEDRAITLTGDDFKDAPTIKTMLDHALDIPVPGSKGDPVSSGITIMDSNNKYFLFMPGPLSIGVNNHMSEKEFNQYQLWFDENFVGHGRPGGPISYYIEYEEEVFDFEFHK